MEYLHGQKASEGLVSIIMPAYNCQDFIGIALESVANQSYQNWEVIIVDDCSTDATAEVVYAFASKKDRIKYFKLDQNSGAAIARNKALEIAEGKYIAFLDSDDVWFPQKLAKQIHFMELNDYSFSCTSYTKIDKDGKDLDRIIKAQPKSDYHGVLKTCPGNSTVVYNADKLGKFNIPDIKKRNDYTLWLQVIKKAKYLYGLEEPLSSHRVNKGSISSNKFSLVGYHWNIYRKIERLSLAESGYLIVYWIFATVFKLR